MKNESQPRQVQMLHTAAILTQSESYTNVKLKFKCFAQGHIDMQQKEAGFEPTTCMMHSSLYIVQMKSFTNSLKMEIKMCYSVPTD